MIAIRQDPSVLRVDEHGTVRVGKTRVTLETVIHCYLRGDSPDEILEGFPTLTLDAIYATIAYYLRHRDEVDEYLAEGERIAAYWRAFSERDPRVRAMKRRLEQARTEWDVPDRR